MFVIDILIYVFFAWMMCHYAENSCKYYPDTDYFDKYIKRFILFFVIINAVKYGVGKDYWGYARGLASGYDENYDCGTEYLFYWFNVQFSNVGLPVSLGFAIFAFIQIFFIVLAVRKQKYLLVFIPVVLFGGRYFLDMMNAIRQMIVACAFLWAAKFIIERKFKQYIMFIIAASTIHQSAFMLLPIYFIPVKCYNLTDKRMWLIGILLVCLLLGQTPSFQGAVSYIEGLTSLFGYEDKTEFIENVLSRKQSVEALGFGPIMLSFLLCAILIIWYGPSLKQRYGDVIPMFDLWYAFSFFYSSAFFLICNVSHYLIRPIQYFELFQMLMLALILYDIKERKGGSSLNLWFVISIIWVTTVWGMIKNEKGKFESATYKFIFFHQDDMDSIYNGSIFKE